MRFNDNSEMTFFLLGHPINMCQSSVGGVVVRHRLAINRSRVLFSPTALSSTHVPLSPSSVIWNRQKQGGKQAHRTCHASI